MQIHNMIYKNDVYSKETKKDTQEQIFRKEKIHLDTWEKQSRIFY